MGPAEIVSAGVAVATALAALLAYFKRKPGQREKDEVETATGELNLAEGTVTLVQSTLHAEFARMTKRMEAMEEEAEQDRHEFAQYRRDTENRIAELAAELRAAKAEKLLVQHENEQLRARVRRLEAEVEQLRAERP